MPSPGSRLGKSAACTLLIAIIAGTAQTVAAQVLGPAAGTAKPSAAVKLTPPPLDPQLVQDQDDMTWDDYKPLPGINWADPAHKPTQRTIKVALVMADFDDQPFVMTLKKNQDIFGNPQIDPVKREDIPKFYAKFWNGQDPLHHGHTVNEYWMEQSHGRIGVSFEPFGPYHMPKKIFQYGLAEYGQEKSAPPGFAVDNHISADCDALWAADAGLNVKQNFNLVLRLFAGYDETCVWQEFGEMKFQTRDDITPEFGNPDPTKPRWAPTRYVPWTSWKAAEMPWSNSAIINGESSGSIVHEVSHAAFRVGDNNNNSFVTPYRRAGAGPWDIMDRGSFNGPGGVHNRWQVPVLYGGAMPAGVMLRQRINFGFSSLEQVLSISRSNLAQTGLVVARVVAREVDPAPGSYTGIVVHLDGGDPRESPDRTPYTDPRTDPLSSGDPLYTFYSLEVIQRIGFDSFCPDSGVLLAKNKDRESPTDRLPNANGFNCFNWVIDAHPEDINMLDFKRPNGEKVMRTIADYRQLNDALFHAGTDSGSQYESEDTPNRLHFYIIDMKRDDKGVLAYTLGVKSLDGPGPQKRGVALTAGGANGGDGDGNLRPYRFTLRNTGQPAPNAAELDSPLAKALTSDIYRLQVKVEGLGWHARLLNNLAAVKFGESMSVPVYLTHDAGAAASAHVTLTATSESDPSQKSESTIVAQ